MSAQRFVKPAEGRRPRHENTARPIAAEGEWVNDTPFIRRRLLDGDLIECEPPADVSTKTTAEKKTDKH
jgi:hypothetical protein